MLLTCLKYNLKYVILDNYIQLVYKLSTSIYIYSKPDMLELAI